MSSSLEESLQHKIFLKLFDDGDWDAIASMLAANPELVKVKIDGATVLHLAANKGNVELVKLLISANPELVNTLTDFGNSVLEYACNAEIAKLLIDTNPELLTKYGGKALQVASECRHVEVVKLLIDTNPELLTNYGVEALLAATHYGASAVVKVFIDRDPQLVSKYARKLFINAVECESYDISLGHKVIHSEIIKLLLQVNPNLPDIVDPYYGLKALDVACKIRERDAELIKLLFDHEAVVKGWIDWRENVNHAVSYNGDTMLHIAIEVGNAHIVKLLMDAGANPYATNEAGVRPYESLIGKIALFTNEQVTGQNSTAAIQDLAKCLQLVKLMLPIAARPTMEDMAEVADIFEKIMTYYKTIFGKDPSENECSSVMSLKFLSTCKVLENQAWLAKAKAEFDGTDLTQLLDPFNENPTESSIAAIHEEVGGAAAAVQDDFAA